MHSDTRERLSAVLDRLDDELDALNALDFEGLTTPERLATLTRLERLRRRLPVAEHQLINQLASQATPAELGHKLSTALSRQLLISRRDANRRIAEAADLGPRRTLTGQPLAPILEATAAAQRDGAIGAEAVAVIRSFYHRLPNHVSVAERDAAETDIAGFATEFDPDHLRVLARAMTNVLVPDGLFSDVDRARRRSLTIGSQDVDGMSPINGWLTPQARAGLEAVLARWAAPGMCNPADPDPTVDGTPSQQAIDSDTRDAAQRNHDGLAALTRAMLCSGKLGQHNGLPATIIVSTTLTELERGAGRALTAGGTLLPLEDVVQLASHAHHYLAIFDKGKAIGLYHTKRLAGPGQRAVLHARDRGCTFPTCDVPGYLCEAHHVRDYAESGRTDIDELTLCCGTHHRLVTSSGWVTRKRRDGTTEWIPPAHLDQRQPRTNIVHHPEKLLRQRSDNAEPG